MPDHVEIRPAEVAGLFYPEEPSRLVAAVSELLSLADPGSRSAGIRAVLAPHAGYAYSGKTAGRAYGLLAHGDEVTRVLVLAPSHRHRFRGIDVGPFSAFQTPLGDIPVDRTVCEDLLKALPGLVSAQAEVHKGEHAIEVQLPLLQVACPHADLVPILCGACNRDDSALIVDALTHIAAPAKDNLWVVSSDLTHYGTAFGYAPFPEPVGPRIEDLDKGALILCLAQDPEGFRDYISRTGMTACGAAAIGLLLESLQRCGPDWQGRLVDYTTSSRLDGNTSHSVSYASLIFTDVHLDPGDVDKLDAMAGRWLLHRAREAVATRLGTATMDLHEDAVPPPALQTVRACFVTLTVGGCLRGCMGTLEAVQPLCEAVEDYAEEAAFRDPRFLPIRTEELADVHFEISVLTPLRRIDSPEAFIPGRHGVLLEKGRHSAVYLPNVARDHGWDRETTLDRLCRKAGLPAGAWRRNSVRLAVFEAQCFAE